jgi:hypothetical protein
MPLSNTYAEIRSADDTQIATTAFPRRRRWQPSNHLLSIHAAHCGTGKP